MIVDSSVWIEILQSGPLHNECHKAMARQSIRIPALVLHEVYKKVKSRNSEESALEAVASLSQFEILDLNREVALLAADLCLEYEISMADGIVLAHAQLLQDTLITLDNDFAQLPGARVIR